MNHLERIKHTTQEFPPIIIAKFRNLIQAIDQSFFPPIDKDFDPTLEGTEVAPNIYHIGYQTYIHLDENHPQFKDYSLQTLDSAS